MAEDFDMLAARMQEKGEGEWEIQLESDETVTARLDDVSVSEERGFSADGTDDDGRPVELTTGIQPGGPIELRRRESEADDWETLGEVAEAIKRG